MVVLFQGGFRIIGLYLFLILLTSCTSKISSINSDRDLNLNENEGYLLLEVDTREDLKKIAIGGEKHIELTTRDLRSGSNYILVSLPAGDYHIEKVQTKKKFRFRLEEEYWTFQVEKNVISYIGTMSIKTSWFFANMELINNSSLALEYLEENFPNILSSREIVYSGPGEDRFFDLVRKKALQERKEGSSL